MENKAQVIVQNIDEDSVKRGFQTENALVLHVNDKGEGLLTVWGYAHGKKIEGEYIEFDEYDKQLTSQGIYNLTPEQVAALQKEKPGTEKFDKVLDEIKKGENLEDLYSSMSTRARDMMTELLEKDQELVQPLLDAQRSKDIEEYQRFYFREKMAEEQRRTNVADEKLLKFFEGGRL